MTAHTSLGGSANPWSSTVHKFRLLDDPVVADVAKAVGRSSAQVLLRWGVQRDLIVIPKSVNNDRLKANFQLDDFELSDAHMQSINELDKGDIGCFNHPVTPWCGRSLFEDEFEALSK